MNFVAGKIYMILSQKQKSRANTPDWKEILIDFTKIDEIYLDFFDSYGYIFENINDGCFNGRAHKFILGEPFVVLTETQMIGVAINYFKNSRSCGIIQNETMGHIQYYLRDPSLINYEKFTVYEYNTMSKT